MSAETTTDSRAEQRRERFKSLWKANHGNFLLAFVGVIALLNIGGVIYQQSKFVPLKFPDARAFADPEELANPPLDLEQTVTFRVIGAPTMNGFVVLAVFDSSVGFGDPQQARLAHSVPITDGIAVWSVTPDQLPDSLAILAFHDEDEDEVITRNGYGVPIERYGYSANQRFSDADTPPTFEASVIERPQIGNTLDLFIR